MGLHMRSEATRGTFRASQISEPPTARGGRREAVAGHSGASGPGALPTAFRGNGVCRQVRVFLALFRRRSPPRPDRRIDIPNEVAHRIQTNPAQRERRLDRLPGVANLAGRRGGSSQWFRIDYPDGRGRMSAFGFCAAVTHVCSSAPVSGGRTRECRLHHGAYPAPAPDI
jgi:hypothetical protein